MSLLQAPNLSQTQLSVEDSLAIVLITNLIVLMPLVVNLDNNVRYDLPTIVDRLLEAPCAQHCVFDAHLLGQAVHHNQTWLRNKLHWDITHSANTNDAINAVGSWPPVWRRYLVALPKWPLRVENYSVYNSQLDEQIRINKADLRSNTNDHISFLKGNPVLLQQSESAIPDHMHLMAGALENGRRRLRDEIAPKYAAYLEKEKRKSQPQAQAQAQQHAPAAPVAVSPDEQHLQRYLKPILYAFIKYKHIRGCSQYSKAQLIAKILENDAKSEFLQFVIDNNLRTGKDGATYGRARGEADQQVEQGQEQRDAAVQRGEGQPEGDAAEGKVSGIEDEDNSDDDVDDIYVV